MSIRDNEYPVHDLIVPQNVLLSVFNKDNLGSLVEGLLTINPQVHFYSTGGTGKAVMAALEEREVSDNYTSVEDFTGAPEMEGGLVKTLHPKIHAGLLAERDNPAHERYLTEVMKDMTGSEGVYFDLMVGGLYPFADVVAKPDTTPESARGNIDIGGPTMVMAAAKNWPSVAVLTNPAQYGLFLLDSGANQGTNLEQRFALAQEAMQVIGGYRHEIGQHFAMLDYKEDVKPHLVIKEVA